MALVTLKGKFLLNKPVVKYTSRPVSLLIVQLTTRHGGQCEGTIGFN